MHLVAVDADRLAGVGVRVALLGPLALLGLLAKLLDFGLGEQPALALAPVPLVDLVRVETRLG